MRTPVFAITIGLAATMAVGCSRPPEPKPAAPEKSAAPTPSTPVIKPPLPETLPVKPATEPHRIVVQHIYIGFAGKVPKERRTKEEAEKLSHQVVQRARGGENFDDLTLKYTQDQYPGIYAVANKGVQPGAPPKEYAKEAVREFAREKLNPVFGIGFVISPGNIAIVECDPDTSPDGWHIFKRLM